MDKPKVNRSLFIIPRMWPGSKVFILGGGPGMKYVDVSRLEGQHVIAVNNAYQLASWIPVMYFGDWRWYNLHRHKLLTFAGLKLTTCAKCSGRPGIRVVKKKSDPFGLTRDPGVLRWNLSSGACAINLATSLGAKKIVLFGFDMRRVGDDCNYHRDHPDSDNKRKNPYASFMRPFPSIARDLIRMNVECINATPGSELEEFPIVEIESVMP